MHDQSLSSSDAPTIVVEPYTAKKVAVVGCGQMGSDIAAIFLHAGWNVDAITKAAAHWPVRRERMMQSIRDLGGSAPVGTLTFEPSIAEVRWNTVDLVIESLPEDLELKRQTFHLLDAVVPPHVPMTSNSSSYRISEIVRHCGTAERMAGLHFFFPAHIAPLVEVVRGELTTEPIMSNLISIMRALHRMPVRVNRDIPGFLANRIQHALMREVWSLLDAGLASAEDIDKAVQFGFGFRYAAAGPLLQKELTGLDTQLAAATAIYPSLSNTTEPSSTLSKLVAEGYTGTAVGQGLWEWTPEHAALTRQRYHEALQSASALTKRYSKRAVKVDQAEDESDF